jgi:hypothetical protein
MKELPEVGTAEIFSVDKPTELPDPWGVEPTEFLCC